ncbi:protein of unknown function [Acidithiobacillus ferrivorans]|uniref:Uncharacterized protein n=1 Tax=Acidithiobacillus ferrivorans TaxID=160808 RepID=A0ABY1MT78_9PROT|nr:protein of unknown function [Acidithiobacillus ferrivorans]
MVGKPRLPRSRRWRLRQQSIDAGADDPAAQQQWGDTHATDFGEGGLGGGQGVEGAGAEPVEGVVITGFHLFHLDADSQQGEAVTQDDGRGAVGEGAHLNGHRLVDDAGAAGARRTGDAGAVTEDVGRNIHMHIGQDLVKTEVDAAVGGSHSGAAGGGDGERTAHRSCYTSQGGRCGR